jgi:hypothetical protein
VADAYGDRLLTGEIYLPPAKLVAYYGKNLEGVQLPFNFSLLEARWHARTLANLIDEYERVCLTRSVAHRISQSIMLINSCRVSASSKVLCKITAGS